MTDGSTILKSAFTVLHSALLAGAAVSFAAYLAMRHARRIARASDWLTHVPRPRLAAFLAFALVAMMYAQKSGTNGMARMGNAELRAGTSGMSRAEKWWRRGAWEDMLRVEFPPGWTFPSGTGHLARVDVVSQGSLRRRWTDADEIASVGVPLALAPFRSEFRHGPTPSNSYRFAWSGALAWEYVETDGTVSVSKFGITARRKQNGYYQ